MDDFSSNKTRILFCFLTCISVRGPIKMLSCVLEWALLANRPGKRLTAPSHSLLCSLHNTMKRDGPLMHPRVQKWPCAEPQCWQSINLCKPKRAISKYKPMSVWLFSHLQPLTAVTLNQCLWIVWLEKPPHPPQSKASLLVYILNTLFTLHYPLPNRFSSSCPRVLFTSITRF